MVHERLAIVGVGEYFTPCLVEPWKAQYTVIIE